MVYFFKVFVVWPFRFRRFYHFDFQNNIIVESSFDRVCYLVLYFRLTNVLFLTGAQLYYITHFTTFRLWI